jgi:hypothetical protein
MRKLLIAVVLFSGMLIGCTSPETARDHGRRLGLQGDLQLRGFVDDCDIVLLMERNCRLTRWCSRAGY